MKQTSLSLAFVILVGVSSAVGANMPCGDVNRNGTVTTADALSVLKKAVGQDVVLQCPAPAQPAKTGDVTDSGLGSDGHIQAGVERSFTDNGNGTITDNATGLMWEKKDQSGGLHDMLATYSWTSGSGGMDGTIASVFLVGLNEGEGFAGYSDWRIPTVNELQTLLNFGDVETGMWPEFFTSSCVSGCANLHCSCPSPPPTWTSTSFGTGPGPGAAWAIAPGFSTMADGKIQSHFVRAVRSE